MVNSKIASEQQTSWAGRVGYGIGMSGLWLLFMPVALFAFYFYTDIVGLSPTQAGFIFTIAVIWDALTDPIMAWIASRSRNRLGQYRPFILFGAIPLALIFCAMFFTPNLEVGQLFLYALVLHLLFRTAFTVVYIPYTSLIARLSSSADERASIASVKSVFTSIAALFVSFYGLKLVEQFGGGNDRLGFAVTGLLLAGLSAGALLICGSVTREVRLGDQPQAPTDETNPFKALGLLARNGPFLLIFVGVLLFTGCYATINKTTVYFFQYDLGDRSSVRYALSAISVAGLVSPLIWAKVTHMTSKRVVWMIGCGLAATSMAVFYLSELRDVTQISIAYFIAGCGIQAFLMTFFAMTADAIDYGHWKFGRRSEAMGFGLLSFANKTSLAIGGGLLGVGLSAVGYVANESQSPETLQGIRMILCFVPVIGFTLSAAVISFFPISTRRHQEIAAALAEGRFYTDADQVTDHPNTSTTSSAV